mgnify:FL=1
MVENISFPKYVRAIEPASTATINVCGFYDRKFTIYFDSHDYHISLFLHKSYISCYSFGIYSPVKKIKQTSFVFTILFILIYNQGQFIYISIYIHVNRLYYKN